MWKIFSNLAEELITKKWLVINEHYDDFMRCTFIMTIFLHPSDLCWCYWKNVMVKALQCLWWGYRYSNDTNLCILELTGGEMGSPPNLEKEHLSPGHQHSNLAMSDWFLIPQGPCSKSSLASGKSWFICNKLNHPVTTPAVTPFHTAYRCKEAVSK